jgi:hypothetical protein
LLIFADIVLKRKMKLIRLNSFTHHQGVMNAKFFRSKGGFIFGMA